MYKITAAALMLLISSAALAQQDVRIANACAVDAARSCKVPMPTTADFKPGGIVYNCLQTHLASGDLSRTCWDAITQQ
jgi:hypothetical protein